MRFVQTPAAALAALAMLAALVTLPAHAGPLHRSETGTGSAVIVPFWTVDSEQDSLLIVRNDAALPSAVRVRVLDEHGTVLLALGVYLDPGDQWTAAFTDAGFGTELLSADSSCVLLEDGTGRSGAGGAAAGVAQLPATAGSIEIIEMATAPADSQAAPGGQWPSCATLVQRFADGSWADLPNSGLGAPGDGIGATLSILRVGAGTMSTIEGTALRGFSDGRQHAPASALLPDLSSAVDHGSGNGRVRSRVCFDSGCRVDEWDEPLKAVAAALTVVALRAEFSVSPTSGGLVDLVLHRPLERYESETGLFIDTQASMRLMNRDGTPVLPAESMLRISEAQVLQLLAFDPEGPGVDPPVAAPSPVLGYVSAPEFSLSAAADNGLKGGIAEVRFETTLGQAVMLTAPDNYRYAGEPVIAFGIQQFTNGFIDVGGDQPVLSNYRGTISPRMERRLDPPLL